MQADSASSMNFLGDWSIKRKLGALAAFSALVLVLLSSYFLWHQYQESYESRKISIRQSVEVATSIVDSAHRQEVYGLLTREQAQAMAIKAVTDARYAGKECISG